ncbi:MAG: arsenate reductase [Enterobacterales bacterium]|jgi:arsenate reductase
MITLYGIKACDTVKKARHYLDANNVDFNYHDFRINGLEKDKLSDWIKAVGWKVLLNTRSTSWRQLTDKQKQDIDENSALALMMDNPTLIKRPVLETSTEVIVGFKAEDYQQVS